MTWPDTLRTLLFVPATRPERFIKALDSGADAVIIDLEDAVEAGAKDAARENVVDFARQQPEARFLVRVNDVATPWFQADMAACRNLSGVVAIMLPKADAAALQATGTQTPLLALVESARGIHDLTAVASHPAVQRMAFGTLDMMLDLGVTPGTEAARVLLDELRVRIALESRVHGLAAPVDGVYPALDDSDGLAAFAAHARDMGYGGMLCIHPRQVTVVHATFRPDDAELDWARRVVAAARDNDAAAFRLDGQMVDRPVVERARQVLARASD